MSRIELAPEVADDFDRILSHLAEHAVADTPSRLQDIIAAIDVLERLGLRCGSKVEFVVVGDRVELRIRSTPVEVPVGGFGMIRSRLAAVPADFDPADIIKP